MNNNDNNAETPNQENTHENLSNSLNNTIPKKNSEFTESLDLKKSESESLPKIAESKEILEELKVQNNENNPKSEKKEQSSIKYTPLNQDAKPFNYKKIKERIYQQNAEDNINSNYENRSATNTPININEKSSDVKRNNFAKKNNYSLQSPLLSYFNDSQRYLSEQYGQNIMKKPVNIMNKMTLVKDNNNNSNNKASTPIDDTEDNNKSNQKKIHLIIMILIFSIIIIVNLVLICQILIIQYLIII